MSQHPSILIIYTGGTIGMSKSPHTGALAPLDFDNIANEIPELKRLQFQLNTLTIDPVKDSSNIMPDDWDSISRLIHTHYQDYDGFVVLHGTDTMAFTASALSFSLQNLGKPVVLTGSQLPIGELRTDGRENFITAIEIAGARKPDGTPIVPEVCICFGDKLLRGNRTKKVSAEQFSAFRSDNYPALAQIGTTINFQESLILPPPQSIIDVKCGFSSSVALAKLYPGIKPFFESTLLSDYIKAIVMESYGSGNAPTDQWFIDALDLAQQKGIHIINISQCTNGSVNMGKYETSLALESYGVIDGKDLTSEAALTKAMFLIGQGITERKQFATLMQTPLCGEIS